MGTDNIIFLELLEWFDESGTELLHRLPEKGSGEIKFGAQLVVRESQTAVLFYKGKSYEAFPPGRHTLTTANIPVLTKVLSIPWGMASPLRAEAYFINMKVFPNLKWGTRDPVAFKDADLGLVRLRAHGVFNIRVIQPLLFINTLVGTSGVFSTADIEEYLKHVIVSRFNDHLGEHLDSLFDLPGRYDELSRGLQERLEKDFSRFGIALSGLYIGSITPPPEVQQAIDDKGRLSTLTDLDKLVKMKAAMAMERAAGSQGDAGSGMGMGLGFMMPAMFAHMFAESDSSMKGVSPTKKEFRCPDCDNVIEENTKFCPFCGHQQLIFDQCRHCGKNLPPKARFCPKCGKPVHDKPMPRLCPQCGAENLPDATFCNQCGERL